jgi:hypothetical protein
MNCPVFFRDIEHDGTGLENRQRPFAIGRVMIYQDRHARVWINRQKLLCELITLADVALDHAVVETTFFKLNGDFFAVGRRPVVKIEHDGSPDVCFR